MVYIPHQALPLFGAISSLSSRQIIETQTDLPIPSSSSPPSQSHPQVDPLSVPPAEFSSFPFSPGFAIESVASLVSSLPTHSWEYGVASEALLELYSPQYSVFGSSPFPVPTLGKEVKALEYAASKIQLGGSGIEALSPGDGAAGDPASLGVLAVLLGKSEQTYADAAHATVDALLSDVPRYENGAISHRVSVPELWADFMYMVPPFLAYYAASERNATLLEQSILQCGLYREVLQVQSPSSSSTSVLLSHTYMDTTRPIHSSVPVPAPATEPTTTTPFDGAWTHIKGSESQDIGVWSTGNGWAAAGMARVLATLARSESLFDPPLPWYQQATNNLTQWIREIVDAALASPLSNGLLKNYWNDEGDLGFGEVSGSALVASVVYRMAVLQPTVFNATYIAWADAIRDTFAGVDASGVAHVSLEGVVSPAVNPLAWTDTTPVTTGSPEGQAFVVLLFAAWRDCVLAGSCVSPAAVETPSASMPVGVPASTPETVNAPITANSIEPPAITLPVETPAVAGTVPPPAVVPIEGLVAPQVLV